MIESPEPTPQGQSSGSSVLHNVVTQDMGGVKSHTFFFQDPTTGVVLGLSNIAEKVEDAADNLAKMLEGMIIELRMHYPKVEKPKDV